MRTTVDLEPEVLREAKERAGRRHTTLSAVVEDALRETAARRKAARRSDTVTLTVDRRQGGPRPGVDLDDNAALLDFMDEGESRSSGQQR